MHQNRPSTRYVVICHLMLVMGLTVAEATQVVADLEEAKLLTFDKEGNLKFKVSEEQP